MIQRRENNKDIWYHLYEFPYEEHADEPTTEMTNALYPMTHIVHVLSHQKIHARFIVHRVQKMPEIPGTMLIRWDDLDDYALSRLTLRALDTMRSILPR